MTPRFSALLLVAATSTAAANTVATDSYGTYATEERPAVRRVEGRVGFLIGGSDVGDADGFSVGVGAGIGYRIGDITLRGTFDHYRTGDSGDEGSDRRGRGTRAGAALRYSFANTGNDRDRGLGVDFWGEAGIGLEHVAWRQGGVLDRPSGELAVGFELDGQGERGSHGRRRHVGYFMAFRSLIAQGPEMDGPAVCGGPCTRATKPSRTDVSMFFELGLHWGR
jgi:hypothetical protein